MTTDSTIECMLLRWGEGPSGRTVTFLLPDDPGPHPFRGLKCGPAHGQRLGAAFALISDDETTTPLEPAGALQTATGGYRTVLEPTERPPQAPEKPATGPNGNGVDKHRLSRQAAMCCQDARFRKFIEEKCHETVGNADEAAAFVRFYCEVESRAELDIDAPAAREWCNLHSRYIAWRETP